MNDVDKIGGIPVVMKALLDAGFMHGDTLTVTGKTMRENLEALAPKGSTATSCAHLDKPIHATGGITILRGSLAPEGAVVKSAGFDDTTFTGTARVFDGERKALDALADGEIKAARRRRHPLRGPQGRPRHARDARHHRRDQGRRPRQGRPAHHRRPVLRRHHRAVRGPHRPRGRRRRTDRVRPRRRPDHPRRRRPHPRRRDRRPGGAQGGLGAAARRSTPAVSSASTPRSSSPPPTARSAADRHRLRELPG